MFGKEKMCLQYSIQLFYRFVSFDFLIAFNLISQILWRKYIKWRFAITTAFDKTRSNMCGTVWKAVASSTYRWRLRRRCSQSKILNFRFLLISFEAHMSEALFLPFPFLRSFDVFFFRYSTWIMVQSKKYMPKIYAWCVMIFLNCFRKRFVVAWIIFVQLPVYGQERPHNNFEKRWQI